MKEDLATQFAALEKHPLPVETIICGVCGNILSSKDKTTRACEHQKQMVEGLEKW
jgi:hypothetical protein